MWGQQYSEKWSKLKQKCDLVNWNHEVTQNKIENV